MKVEIEIPDGYELGGQFTSTEGDKIVGIGYKLKPVNRLKKLIDRFDDLIFAEELSDAVIICAEETKKIAIEFHMYRTLNASTNTLNTLQQIFDKFIEEKYMENTISDLSSFTKHS